MAWTCVPHIVLDVLCGTRTSGVHFRPPKVSFSAIFAISGVFFYKAFFQNWFSQNPLMGWFCPSGIWICTSMHHLCKAKKIIRETFFRSQVPETCGSIKWIDKKDGKLVSKILFFVSLLVVCDIWLHCPSHAWMLFNLEDLTSQVFLKTSFKNERMVQNSWYS